MRVSLYETLGLGDQLDDDDLEALWLRFGDFSPALEDILSEKELPCDAPPELIYEREFHWLRENFLPF